MKLALVTQGALWCSPFVRIYTRILDSQKVDYTIISWNRDGNDEPEGIQYQTKVKSGEGYNGSASLSDYIGYISFVKKNVVENGFDHLIVFGPQMVCLLAPFLYRRFNKKFILDYRDLSIEQKTLIKPVFSFITKYSYANIISSPGFKRCLPRREYVLSHNIDVDIVNQTLKNTFIQGNVNIQNKINILTIGAIRDFSSNVQIIDALANKEEFILSFVGRGISSASLADYCKEKSIGNVIFKGFYEKQEEPGYIEDASFLNIFYPRIITHDTALSNRFYNSLIYKRPMIVTKGTTQGDYAENYNVGIAVDDCKDLANKLNAFVQQDYLLYAERCNNLLREFLKDQERFEDVVKSFVCEP